MFSWIYSLGLNFSWIHTGLRFFHARATQATRLGMVLLQHFILGQDQYATIKWRMSCAAALAVWKEIGDALCPCVVPDC